MKTESRLLINESPLQVLPSLAVAVGLNEAIFLQQLQYWLFTSRHFFDGRKWVYNSRDEWNKQFPFWSNSTLKRVIKSVREQGVAITRDDLNKVGFDHTLWYSIDYDEIDRRLEEKERDSRVDEGDPSDWTNPTNRLGQNDPIDEANLTQSNGSERPNRKGQNDPSNTNRLPIDYQPESNNNNNKAATAAFSSEKPTDLAVPGMSEKANDPEREAVLAAWRENMPQPIVADLNIQLSSLLDEVGAAAILRAITTAVLHSSPSNDKLNFAYVSTVARNDAAGVQKPVKASRRKAENKPEDVDEVEAGRKRGYSSQVGNY